MRFYRFLPLLTTLFLFAALGFFRILGCQGSGGETAGGSSDTGTESDDGEDSATQSASLTGEVFVFNGIPNNNLISDEGGPWGEDFIFRATAGLDETRTLGALGGTPVVDIYTSEGGVAFFNTATYQEAFTARVTSDGSTTTVTVSGGSGIERYEHGGDYYEALQEFAARMRENGVSPPEAPEEAFDAVWETYGYEENFTVQTIREVVPYLQELGITTITIDSGWYGSGIGELEFDTGDFQVNPDIIGDVNGDDEVDDGDMSALIDELHEDGFKVRLWWVSGVGMENTDLFEEHDDWFYTEVVSSTSDTEDIYLDPTMDEVVDFQRGVAERFVGMGADGFKIDAVFQISVRDSDDREEYVRAYAELMAEVYDAAVSAYGDGFAVNIDNCGLAQNFYDFPAENMIATSDPVSARQLRLRGKYLRAVTEGRMAILSDHVELTAGDFPDPERLQDPAVYDNVDFASVVPLGMVLETKFRADNPPGDDYLTWFTIYRNHRFYDMEWVNIPYLGGMETYLMRDGADYYFSFFTEEDSGSYDGTVTLTNLPADSSCDATELVTGAAMESFETDATATHELAVNFARSLAVKVICE